MKTTLFKKILIIVTAILILSLTVAISVNIYMTKNNYDKNIKDEMHFLSIYYNKELKHYIQTQVDNLDHIVNSREFDSYAYNLQDKLIKELFKNYSDVFPNIYFIMKDDSVISYKEYPIPAHLFEKKEQNMKKFKENPNKIFVSDIEYCDLLKRPVIALSILKRNYFGEDIGIFFAVVPIDSFIHRSYIELNKDFRIRIIDKKGYIASSSNVTEIMKKLSMQEVVKKQNMHQSKLMEEESWYDLTKTPYGDIIISYPHKYFQELVNSYIQMNIFIYVIILFIAFFIIFIFSKSLTNPLEYLLNQIEEYSQGNYTKKIKLKTNDEISLLAESFNSLGNELENKRNELLDINKNLEERVAKEVEKNIQKEHLLMEKSKLASIAGIMDAVAHQWKQPLSVISLTSSNLRLQNEIKDTVPKELIDKTAKDIDLQIRHLIETVDEFRKFFRTDGKKELVSFKKLIESVLQINKSLLNMNNIDVIVDVDKDLKYEIFQAEFKHVFINFINNTKDAFIQNNIKNRKLIFNFFENDSTVTITVTDNAGGIPEEIINTIFDANITTKANGQGTGIGLYMSKQIIEKINGTLSVENIEFSHNGVQQKGAKFKIILPKC